MSKTNDLLVGIDLGTSRSAIATSNGERHWVDSFVGWPADLVARKVLKRNCLVGHEAIENRSMLDLHRPLERGLLKEGSPRDQEAVRELLSYLLETSGVTAARAEGVKVRAVVGVPAEAMRVSKQHLRDAVRGFVDNLIIVSEPFAVAYGLEALLHTLVVDLGAGTTDFCLMKGRYPTEEDQRTLPNAGDWVDDQLVQLLNDRHPEIKVSRHTVCAWKEAHSFVGSPKKPVKVTVPVAGKPTEVDITEEIRLACEALVPPVVETMLDLIASAEAEYQERIRQSVILAGGSSGIAGFGERLEQSLRDLGGGSVRVVEDPIFAGAAGGLALAEDAPKSDWEKLPA